MSVRNILESIAIALIACACGPSRYAVQIEMRYPSKSGVDLAGKIVSVVYVSDSDSVASRFNGAMAEGFAYALEQDYGTGDGSIGLYEVLSRQDTDYASRDSMFNYLMTTGADVVFLFGLPQLGQMNVSGATKVTSASSADSSYVSSGGIQYKLHLYCYDAMNKEDKVIAFGGVSTATPYIYSNGKLSSSETLKEAYAALPEAAFQAGRNVAEAFKAQWKHEQYSIAYYDSQKWYEALYLANQYEWKAAIDIWLGLLDTSDIMKKACAEYNIAVACYMLGDYALALEWLDRSDADNNMPTLSDAMRKRINARL